MPSTPALASVSVDRIANAFLAWTEDDPGRYWWWPRDIRLDPDEVIADDGEGNTFRVPFTTDGELGVTFGEPVEVRETFIDVAAPAAAAAAAGARVGQRVLARGLPKPDKPDPNTPAASRPRLEENQVPERLTALRRDLDALGDDATEEQINEVLAAHAAEPPTEPEEPEAEVTEPETDPIAETQARTLQETTQRIATLEAQAAARVETESRQRRDGLATAWVADGRIAPAERDHYRSLLDIDEDRTVALAGSLAPGRIPVAQREIGSNAATDGQITSTGWFPSLYQEA